MNAATRSAIARAVGAAIVNVRPLSGGSINEAAACKLDDGRKLFVKWKPGCDPTIFPLEARGLEWLAESQTIRVPRVIAVNDTKSTTPFLALELIEPGARRNDYDQLLGRQLAALHRSGAPKVGLDHDNFLATLPQSNVSSLDWPRFYSECRLAPLVKRAIDAGHAPGRWNAQFASIAKRMPELVGTVEPPARLHGDLWSGNLHTDQDGAPVLIDPAVYGGDREIDLAMMRLFGAPSQRFFAAYDEAYPRRAGAADRVPLYQLYPLLAHVNLFGGSYVASVDAALDQIC